MKKLLFTILLATVPALADFQVPELRNPVNDYANVLTRSGKEQIARDIIQLKKETGAQAGVLIVESLDGSSVEEAAMATARKWKLGSKDRDDGILLLIATKDRKIRIEVGYGLESIVTDYYAKKITGTMKGYLKSGNYDRGVSTAITGIGTVIRAHSEEITSKGTVTGTPSEDGGFSTFILFVFGLIAFGTGLFIYVLKKDAESRRISKKRITPEQAALARKMDRDLQLEMKRNPPKKTREVGSRKDDDDDSFVSGAIVGSLLGGGDSGSSSSSSSDSFSSSSSDWGGGGGDFGGGGSSDSF